MSTLSAGLQEQMESLSASLAAQPNKLLLRCVQFSASIQKDLRLGSKERSFLEDNKIATFTDSCDYMGDRNDGGFVEKFLPPWDGIFSQLAQEMKAFRPTEMRNPTRLPENIS
jgi:hypothetical protein